MPPGAYLEPAPQGRNAFQPSYGGGNLDGFLAALSPDGSKLCYGTYVGGKGHDILEGIVAGKGKVLRLGHFGLAGAPTEGMAGAKGIRRRPVRRLAYWAGE
jgi:hypothetical protein